MSWVVICVLAAVGFVVFPLRSWADKGPVTFPGPDEGYTITPSDSEQLAPQGYEGRTDTVTATAVGDSPYTTGKRVVMHFTLGNQIKTCPNVDGTAEGTGLFSMGLDSTTVDATGTTFLHVEVTAKAKYKGQVGDDAWIEGPVNADIDYTYSVTSNFRGPSGAIASSPEIHLAQHITIPVGVSRTAMSPPTVGAMSGGDPTQGQYSEAYGAGIAVAYWGGVYYSIAETKWRQGECVHIVFNPPSKTMRPVLGGDTTVNASLRTKGGENVAANYQDVHAYVGTVDPMGGSSTADSPMKFIYTAPNKAPPKEQTAGFHVSAVSHAGINEAGWISSLGTDWSGEITCSHQYRGDQGQNDLQTWSNYATQQVSVTVDNGAGQGSSFDEVKTMGINKQRALRGGAITFIDDTSDSSEESSSGASKATLQVDIDKSNGTYAIRVGFTSVMKPGKLHSVSCYKDNCHSTDRDYPAGFGCSLNGLAGKLSDLNHLQGSQNTVKSGLGRARNGTMTDTLTWNLARSGTH